MLMVPSFCHQEVSIMQYFNCKRKWSGPFIAIKGVAFPERISFVQIDDVTERVLVEKTRAFFMKSSMVFDYADMNKYLNTHYSLLGLGY